MMYGAGFHFMMFQKNERMNLGPIYEKGYETKSKPPAMYVTEFRPKGVFGNFARP